MPKFKKLILKPGVHRVGRIDGSTELVAITPERIKTWVENTNKARACGVSIPAPFAHQDSKLRFPLPVRLGGDGASLSDAYSESDGISWDSSINAGFWDDPFEIDPETGGLVGVVDAPGNEEDVTTPAGKIGKVVRETSVFTMGPRTILDKDGNPVEIGEHLAHVALVLHPAENGQKNFQPIGKNEEQSTNISLKDKSLAMSICMADMLPAGPTPGAPLQDQELVDTIGLLASVAYISLPQNTSRENFITNLNICLRQKAVDKQEKQKEEESLTQRPPGAETRNPSIAMSENLQPNEILLSMFMSNIVKAKKKSLKERVDALVASGRVRKAYADEKLYPRIESMVLSPDQVVEAKGETPRDPIDDLIDALEQTSPLAGPSIVDNELATFSLPPGAQVEQPPEEGLQDIPEKDAEDIVRDALAYA